MIAESMPLADWLCVVALWTLLFAFTAIMLAETSTGDNDK